MGELTKCANTNNHNRYPEVFQGHDEEGYRRLQAIEEECMKRCKIDEDD